MLTDELSQLLARAEELPDLPSPVVVEETVHGAFRSCIDALSALTLYRVAAEVADLPGLVTTLEDRHAFLRQAIAEFSLWQRELRGVVGPAQSVLELTDD
jgi:hypothetical protein